MESFFVEKFFSYVCDFIIGDVNKLGGFLQFQRRDRYNGPVWFFSFIRSYYDISDILPDHQTPGFSSRLNRQETPSFMCRINILSFLVSTADVAGLTSFHSRNSLVEGKEDKVLASSLATRN